MNRKSEDYEGYVLSCHCQAVCPAAITPEGKRILSHAIVHQTQLLVHDGWPHLWPEGDQAVDEAIDLMEDLQRLDSSDCNVCLQCSEFNPYRCPLCDGPAGERHAVAKLDRNGDIWYLGACPDCYFYIGTGQHLDD